MSRLLDSWHACAFAAYPLLYVVAANALVYPIRRDAVLVTLAGIVAAVVVTLWALGRAWSSLPARANCLSLFLFACGCYPAIRPWLASGEAPPGAWRAAAYLVGAAGLAVGIVRPWRRHLHRSMPLTVMAAVLVLLNLWTLVVHSSGPRTRWEPAVAALAAVSLTSAASSAAPPERDVYLLIFDGLARADVLQDVYGLDVSRDVAAMQAQGFYLPARSRSNYAQTFLSIASILNLAYLDDVAQAMGESSHDRRPLKAAIGGNALMQLARRAGYRVVAIGSDYTATDTFAGADVCFCSRRGPTELQFAAMKATPLVDLRLYDWIAAARRRAVTDALADIERAAQLPGRKFVVAHIITPHPPFVIDHAGRPRTPPDGAPAIEGEWLSEAERATPGFSREYVAGYRDQSRFALDRVADLVGQALSRPGPRPAIVIVGDHGPALGLHFDDPTRTGMRERFGAFAAYHLPGDSAADLYPTMSVVNGARELANRYLNARLPRLADRVLFSTWPRPYRLLEQDGNAF